MKIESRDRRKRKKALKQKAGIEGGERKHENRKQIVKEEKGKHENRKQE